MTDAARRGWRNLMFALICANTALFFTVALSHNLPSGDRAAVFVDFWGRFTVYSLWFVGFALYVRFLSGYPAVRALVVALIMLNIVAFLTLAWLGRISNAPATLVYIDFWGRITVYSLWFLCYEGYRAWLAPRP